MLVFDEVSKGLRPNIDLPGIHSSYRDIVRKAWAHYQKERSNMAEICQKLNEFIGISLEWTTVVSMSDNATTEHFFVITPPFPPTIDLYHVVLRNWNRRKKRPPSRPPNSFVIYRIVFEKEALCRHLYFDQTELNRLYSVAWQRENDVVKSHYEQLSIAAKQIHNHLYEEFVVAESTF